ncbi:MAG: 16S rRNA (cytosine(967)-C(5))-methyltransferase RsmB [Streptococcaceae bacterium]|nr:16S rRNA (cytosine(967)-C(5))-methyltransferase RsmB [Streptococcaceae bacterium]
METNARHVALEILIDIFGNDAYGNISIDRHLRLPALTERDRGFVTALVYGVVAKKELLAWYVAPFLKKQPKLWAQALLWLTVYQIVFMDKVPTSAAVDEAVKLAKAHDGQSAGNFVNAVMRTLMRSGRLDELPKDWETRYSMPKVILDKLVRQFGGKRTGEMLISLDVPAKASVRLVSHREDVLNELSALTASEIAPSALVAPAGNFAATDSFKNGWLTLQDETSQLVAPILMADSNGTENVLDACAAPGGKTCHIASFLTSGQVTACDLYAHKLELIEQNAARLGVADKITTVKADAMTFSSAEKFERILVDAPCSGLGLMRRKPDIKYRKTARDFADLQKNQLQILDTVSKALTPDGVLVYSTCTLADEENFDVVAQFLSTHADFEHAPISDVKPDLLTDGCVFITPERYHTDGFFIAKFRKIK